MCRVGFGNDLDTTDAEAFAPPFALGTCRRGHLARLAGRRSPRALLESWERDKGVPSTSQANRTPAGVDLPQIIADALSCTEDPDAANLRRYQSLVGALLYVAYMLR